MPDPWDRTKSILGVYASWRWGATKKEKQVQHVVRHAISFRDPLLVTDWVERESGIKRRDSQE
jgi:hypothetical protein